MPPRNNSLEGTTAYQEEHRDDEQTTYERLKKGAENFLREIASIHPKLEQALFRTQSEPHLDDTKARQHRAEWRDKDGAITDWDRTAHYRNGEPLPWTQRDPTEAAYSVNECFQRTMGHLHPEEAQKAAQDLASVITRPVEFQLEALANDPSIRSLAGEVEPHTQERIALIQAQISEGLTTNDDLTIREALQDLGNLQHQISEIDPLINHHRGGAVKYTPDMPQDAPSQTPRQRLQNTFRSLTGRDNGPTGYPSSPGQQHQGDYQTTQGLESLALEHPPYPEQSTGFKLSDLGPESEARILSFANRFDPDENETSTLVRQLLYGDTNLLYQSAADQDKVADAIIGEITKFDFPDLQDYHDIADDLSRTLVDPMFNWVPEDDDEAQLTKLNLTGWAKSQLNFVSSYSDADRQSAQLKQIFHDVTRTFHDFQSPR